MSEAEELSHTQHIIYVLFIVVLSITGIYVAFSFLGNVKVSFTFQDYASRLNVVASKLMLTPECFAVSDGYSYTDAAGKTYGGRQVSAGIIDFAKLPGDGTISLACLSRENQSWAKLEDFDESDASKKIKTVWSCPTGMTGCHGADNECAKSPTKLRCETYGHGCEWGCSEPSEEKRKSAEWNQNSRTFFVLIKKGDKLNKGILTVRLKG